MNSTTRAPQGVKDLHDNEQLMAGKLPPSDSVSSTPSVTKNISMVLMNTLDVLRDGCARPTIPASVIQHLLAIAAHPEGLGMSDVAKITGTSLATSYRIVDQLSTGTPDGKLRGLYLTTTAIDPMNRARKVVTLTVKGERIINNAIETLLKGLKRNA